MKKIQTIEKIQEKFSRFLYKKLFRYYPYDIEDEELLSGYELESSANTRQIAQYQEHLENIKINRPRSNEQNYTPFYILKSQTNALNNSPLIEGLQLFNETYRKSHSLDFFNKGNSAIRLGQLKF